MGKMRTNEMTSQSTPSQTVGPFFEIGLNRLYVNDLVGSGVSGERVEIVGKVFDADGRPVPDAMIEIWQANSYGKYAHPEDQQDKPTEPGFQGYGRTATQPDGSFQFKTIKPGRVPGPDGKLQAPHIVVSVFTRGLLRRLVTRIYFSDVPSNAQDYVLNLVDPSRRHTLMAKKSSNREATLEWNVVLQGADETVFFDC
jgi:protocatechuate 3,4-dioxygenase alpha subunit